MNAPPPTARDISIELQKHYALSLPPLLLHATQLVESLPARQPRLAQMAFVSTVERMFSLFRDVGDTFQGKIDIGYYGSAALTRSLFEAVTLVAVFVRDEKADAINVLLASAERSSKKRCDGLTQMSAARNPQVAVFAQRYAGNAERELELLKKIRAEVRLPSPPSHLPDMLARCKSLGEIWEFLYHAIYRDLSEAVHGSFQKLAHSPALAEQTSAQDGGLLYEHCRLFAWAFSFLEAGINECCAIHPDRSKIAKFQQMAAMLVRTESALLERFPASSRRVSVYF